MKKEPICGIYKVTSPIGKIYVGGTKDIRGRLASMKSSISKTIKLLHESFVFFGVEAHKFEIIEECEIRKLVKREKHWISVLNTYKTDHGLNLSKGGIGHSEWSEESKKKIRYSNFKRPAIGASKYRGVQGFNPTSEIVDDTKSYTQWYACIRINGKSKYLGLFRKEKAAAEAYNIAAKKHHGEFANLNKV